MDEGDRPTDSGESAGRDETEETGSEERTDGASRESSGRSPGGDHGQSSGETAGSGGEGDAPESFAGYDAVDGANTDPADGEPGGPSSVPEVEADDAPSAAGEDGKSDPRSAVSGAPEDGESDPRSTGRVLAPEDGGDESLLYRFRHDRDGALMWIREMLASVAVVLLVGLLLFGVSGVWPPMVAVESGSMEPNMQVGDLVFVTEPGRIAPDAADNGVGVVTGEVGQEVGYETFGAHGSVVIYTPPGRTGSPIIHRAMFRVTEGENWYDRADERYHNAVDCESLANCPAPHDGYVTLGDNNGAYDQASGLSPPVRAEWIDGVARLRVPYLGYIRLITTGQVELSEAIARTVGSSLPVAQSTPPQSMPPQPTPTQSTP